MRAPTLVVCGHQDPVTPRADHEARAAGVPDSPLAVVEERGHLCTIEQPVAATGALTRWLEATA